MQILLAGNPNCGKTTLFNALTGEYQKVGNWPGVTVEKKTGVWQLEKQSIAVIDLPGIYSLSLTEKSNSQDENIAAQALLASSIDCIINVVNACHLERHLYLTSQLLELGKPMIVVLTMLDLAKKRGITLDIVQLQRELRCPIVEVHVHKKQGLSALQQRISVSLQPSTPLVFTLHERVQQRITNLQINLSKTLPGALAYYTAWRQLEESTQDELDILLADARYQKIHSIVEKSQKKNSDAREHITAKIDKIVLNRYLALPIFLCVMYSMFLFAINFGGAFQDFFDISSNTIFVQGSAWAMHQAHAPSWLVALVANGIGMGINTTLTFIPVIASMFFFLTFLEESGYMARAAFIVDKIMRFLGLPGKSFVPMIVGFGCNVPAIMAARTLDSERDRFVTIVMSPFMSCSARLAIYAVFVAAFFPTGGQNIVFALYLIGIMMAVLTGFLLRKTFLKGEVSPLILELPAYHKPHLKRLFKETSMRLRYFIIRAGRFIIPVCIFLGGLNAVSIEGTTVLSSVGQWLTPFFSPMGLNSDNWPATVGLLTGVLAKEVVVGTLNSLYAQIGHFSQVHAAHFDFLGSLHAAVASIGYNLTHLTTAFANPILACSPKDEISQSILGMMLERFDGQAGAFAYLLFVLLYIPCVSTMATLRQEGNAKLMWFSIGWSFLIAYGLAVIFYQVARMPTHPVISFMYISILLLLIGMFVKLLYCYKLQWGGRHAVANS